MSVRKVRDEMSRPVRRNLTSMEDLFCQPRAPKAAPLMGSSEGPGWSNWQNSGLLCRCLFLRLGGAVRFDLLLRGLLLVRFGGFVAHDRGWFVGLDIAGAAGLPNKHGDIFRDAAVGVKTRLIIASRKIGVGSGWQFQCIHP